MTASKIILIILLSLKCVSIKAQYPQEIDFVSINEFIINGHTIGNAFYEYPYILKKNYIKKIILKDDEDNKISESEIDKDGNTVLYKTYELKRLKVEIKAEYDSSKKYMKNKLIQIERNDIEKNEIMVTKLGYEDNDYPLSNYEIWVNGKLRDKGNMLYEMLSFASPLTSIESPIWNYDTNFYSVVYIYNHGILGVALSDLPFENHEDEEIINNGLLINIRAIGDAELMYKIYGEGNMNGNKKYEITLQTQNGYEIYTVNFREDKLTRHTIYDKNFKILLDQTYSYNPETKLIDFINVRDSGNKKYVQKFEYEYYN